MINLNLPVNSLSFGHCGVCILKELYDQGTSVNFFPIGNIDAQAYRLEEDFQFWLSSCQGRAKKSYKRTDPGLKLWHIESSENSISNEQTLFTFHEVDSITPEETNILRNQKHVLVSSKYTKETFEKAGLKNVKYCPLGFDNIHFKKVDKPEEDRITFSLFGKFEKRKHTEKVIRAWLKKYKADKDFGLNLHVFNPFFSPEQNNQILLNIFGGQKPWNVNSLPYVQTLAELNKAINYADIVLDMSGGEGFSLPSFHAVALGKHAVLHNCSSIKDWADDSGAVLIEPNGKEEVYDGVFFQKGLDKNQGNIFTWDEDEFLAGCEQAVRNAREDRLNLKGLKLQEHYTWKNTVDIIQENL